MNIIPKRFRFLSESVIQADNPHASGHEIAIAQQTQALAFRGMGNSHTYLYPDPSIAPTATLTSVTTDTSVYIYSSSSAKFMVPWQVQNQYTNVQAIVEFAVDRPYPVRLKMKSETLVTSVTTTSGPRTHAFAIPEGQPDMALWRRDNRNWRTYTAAMLVTPDLGSDRIVALTFDAYLDIPSFIYTASAEVTLKIVSLAVRDWYVRA